MVNACANHQIKEISVLAAVEEELQKISDRNRIMIANPFQKKDPLRERFLSELIGQLLEVKQILLKAGAEVNPISPLDGELLENQIQDHFCTCGNLVGRIVMWEAPTWKQAVSMSLCHCMRAIYGTINRKCQRQTLDSCAQSFARRRQVEY
jgi:hypothetical protein